MFLNDLEITAKNIINPFIPYQQETLEKPEKPSRGLSSCGYDLTLGAEFKRLNKQIIVDPTNPPTAEHYRTITGPIILGAGEFILAHTVETITMPVNLTGFIMDKSSLARLGLTVCNTVLEPGWIGIVTLEIINNANYAIKLTPGMGICQVMFAWVTTPMVAYHQKSAKYQYQTGVQIAK